MKKYSILVIDDEPNNFEVIETFLADENYEVYYTSNGKEALANLDTFNPDLILLDLMMPVMDGLEVCRSIKLMRKWRSIPIIMVTSAGGKLTLSQCLEAGADDFIHKPVDRLELQARVKSMVRIKKQFDRIESLSKLQQNSISALESDFGELVEDLALGFVNELNAPLNNIQIQLRDLYENLDLFSKKQADYSIDLAIKSAVNLQKTTYKFWNYLDFAIERKEASSNEICDIKEIIEQISLIQTQWVNRESNLKLDVDRTDVALLHKHCEWIIKELLDNAIKFSTPSVPIQICGRAIDGSFHLWVNNNPSAIPFDLSLDGLAADRQELGVGLKIVTKIVDMYDGLFSMSNNNYNETTVHLTLPLAHQQHEES
ncbi:hybrid sensor histidine kinase/response regulator [Chamaesiphon polymorphus]|uniref:Response regulatory domain-containing protein n=1 Tax=Chamaesiphon polymorphus CCALA 037 TaxID=2107692 RepID=A0A2T1GC99_9CYAN|nr:hybrid sensor histidine kinase/response regulator [Chamaesiphon polymorphus]PSB55011.1 hypothetical protein C7B77_16405 [Chamaesiphon polymorphus CCALA 037]